VKPLSTKKILRINRALVLVDLAFVLVGAFLLLPAAQPPPQEAHVVTREEAEARGLWDDPTLRYTASRWARGSGCPLHSGCFDYNAEDNLHEYMTQYLYPFYTPLSIWGEPLPEFAYRAPCDSEHMNTSPLEADFVEYTVEISDCDDRLTSGRLNHDVARPRKVNRVAKVVCSGLLNCFHDTGDAKRCCQELP
jgi:hypothetical protein